MQELSFGIIDIIVFFLFLGAVLAVGLYKSKGEKTHGENGAADYFLAGRGLSWWLIGFSLIAANISEEQFVGMSGQGAVFKELMSSYDIMLSFPGCCWALGIIAAIYVAVGGLKACAWTDLLQGSARMVGGGFITYFAFDALGGAKIAELVTSTGAQATIDQGARVRPCRADFLRREADCLEITLGRPMSKFGFALG